MRVLWLCNVVPAAVRETLGGSGSGLWVDHALSDLRRLPEMTLRILCPWQKTVTGMIDDRLSYATFTESVPYRYQPALEEAFSDELNAFRPDVIHIWGTEYAHTLAMVNAAGTVGKSSRVVIGIQGLCSVIARHYSDGLPTSVRFGFTLRDALRWDNVALQQKKFHRRGELERRAVSGVQHIIGRTDWDRACTHQINPEAQYHFCNETLRDPFYKDSWKYASCRKHRVFASSFLFPLKGFHYLLEAMTIVRRFYPDADISVPGSSFFVSSLPERFREETYNRYLAGYCRKHNLDTAITFLGGLSAEQMKTAMLEANVFVLPSTIENSSNSLGEAMLLGVPCVAADAGGTSSLLHPGEGFLYPSSAPYMLAHYIMEVFAMADGAETLGEQARCRALQTHNPEKNTADLLSAYAAAAE